MRIGLDLDNTIVSYDRLFYKIGVKEKFIPSSTAKNKRAVKEYLIQNKKSTILWKKLQGLVYGLHMKNADLMPEILFFLKKLKSENIEFFIVSHKTKYGHFDNKKNPLRIRSTEWMKKNNFFNDKIGLKKENLFFTDTRDEKVRIISDLKCDYFIDDLSEVLVHKKFPKNTKKILFSSVKNLQYKNIKIFNSWRAIYNFFFKSYNESDILNTLNDFVKLDFKSLVKISGNGNSQVFEAKSLRGDLYFIKLYPDMAEDIRSRLLNEFRSLKYLNKNEISNVPTPIKKIDNLNIGVYSWIYGSQNFKVTNHDLKEILNFIKKLKNLSNEKKFSKRIIASEACFCPSDIINQIDRRLENYKILALHNQELMFFLKNDFEPLYENAKKKIYGKFNATYLTKKINQDNMILSPSDFGFHNAIKKNNLISFFDFEYFGWDDPVKLTADFIWHPAMKLNKIHQQMWINKMKCFFSKDKDFISRLSVSFPLFGIRWIMIILNVFHPNLMTKKNKTKLINDYLDEDILKNKINLSKKYCVKIDKLLNEY